MKNLRCAMRFGGMGLSAMVALLAAGCPTGGEELLDDSGTAAADVVQPPAGNSGIGGATSASGLNPEQKRRAEQITSVFENDTLELQYAYMEALDDGRGYTAGRAGFTTGTGDLLIVVERYSDLVPGNELAAYLPRLRVLADANSDSISGLGGLPDAWARAADDARFRTVQDQVVDEEYYQPAVTRWRDAGLKTALSLAAIYDAIIQHGEGDDPDGLPAMMERAAKMAGGAVAAGVSEAAWLNAFLTARYNTLAHAFDPATREEWAEGADRVDPFRTLLDDGNFDLVGPIQISTKDHEATIP